MPSNLIKAEELQHIDLVARVEIAQKIGRILARNSNPHDTESALNLARLLVEDVSVSVREALSRAVKDCTFLPKDIIEPLAQDISQVAMPFLLASKAIDDTLLETIVRAHENEDTQEAIARRNGLSEAVSFAICDVATADVVETLMGNDTADVSERACGRAVKRFPEEQSLLECMAARSDLPMKIAEMIIFKVSRQYSEHLMARFDLAPDYASYLMGLSEREVFARTLEVAPSVEVENYLTQLHGIGGLGSDTLLNYLQNKNIRLFIASIATILGVPSSKLEPVLGGGDKAALAKLLRQCDFSKSVSGVLVIAYERLFRG